MSGVLSENRKLLAGYLSAIGFKSSSILQITMIDLEEEDEILEMLQFCKENHPNIIEEQLLTVAKEISSKKKRRTITDVWNIKDGYKFLRAMDLYLSIKCNYGDETDKLNDEEKTFFLVQVFEEYIFNRSFTGFFFNSCGDFANDIVPALENIGAIKTAEICKKVFRIYGDRVPADMYERENIYNAMDAKTWEFVDKCQHELSKSDDNIAQLCYQFVLDNKDSFSS